MYYNDLRDFFSYLFTPSKHSQEQEQRHRNPPKSSRIDVGETKPTQPRTTPIWLPGGTDWAPVIPEIRHELLAAVGLVEEKRLSFLGTMNQ